MKVKNKAQIAWANFVNNKDNWGYKDPTYGNKIQGVLTREHYIVYNILRGLPIDRGFETTKDGYIESYVKHLDNLSKISALVASFTIKYLLKPFDGTVTKEELLEKTNEALRLYSSS